MKLKNLIRSFAALSLFLSLAIPLSAQQVNTDSLLMEALANAKKGAFGLAKKQAQLGISLAPDYLDFYLVLGRAYQHEGKADSARYCYTHVIQNNIAYEEAFVYLVNLELQEENIPAAEEAINEGIAHFPNKVWFYQKKLAIYQAAGDPEAEAAFLEKAQQQFPENSVLRQRLNFLQAQLKTDRIGLQYSLTNFDRDGVGPWHLAAVQYIRERKWGSLIGRISWADRMSEGQSLANGLQYELESYVFMGKNSYSYADLAFSSDQVFPNYRLAYSFYHNFQKGWEAELGGRLTGIDTGSEKDQLYAIIAGVGKYIGNSWINARSFWNVQQGNLYPAVTLTYRYYMSTRYDYVTAIVGYGSSPDDRTIQNQLETRIALDSYRAGAGYYRLLGEHFVTGLQVMYNHQEYIEGKTQNEFETFLMVQYKF